MDFARVVAQVGAYDVVGFKEGDEVCGCAGGLADLPGTLTENISADYKLIAHKPKSLSMREEAATPLVGITAFEGLYAVVLMLEKVYSLTVVLVVLATLQFSLLITLVHIYFLLVAVINSLHCLKNRVATAINYKIKSVADYVAQHTDGSGFEIVFDSVSGANMANSFEAAALNSQVASTVAMVDMDLSLAHFKCLSLHVVFMLIPTLHNVKRAEHGEISAELTRIADLGNLTPVLDENRYSSTQAGSVHERLSNGLGMGKVVVDVSE